MSWFGDVDGGIERPVTIGDPLRVMVSSNAWSTGGVEAASRISTSKPVRPAM